MLGIRGGAVGAGVVAGAAVAVGAGVVAFPAAAFPVVAFPAIVICVVAVMFVAAVVAFPAIVICVVPVMFPVLGETVVVEATLETVALGFAKFTGGLCNCVRGVPSPPVAKSESKRQKKTVDIFLEREKIFILSVIVSVCLSCVRMCISNMLPYCC